MNADSGKNERGGIQSLERAAAILDEVAASYDGIGLTDLSGKVGLHTSTAFHLIKTLVALGLLVQNADSKRYRIGSRLFALAAGAVNEKTLLTLGTPVLERLSAVSGEATHLAVRSRSDIILVARIAAAGLLQMSERAGITRPAHATAIGKVLLAYMEPQERDKLLQVLLLPKLTPNTITDRRLLRQELDKVLVEGIAHDKCEMDPDVYCIAMPVRDFSGRCVAAIGMSGPVWRMTPENLRERTAQLASAADDLAGVLGHRVASAAIG